MASAFVVDIHADVEMRGGQLWDRSGDVIGRRLSGLDGLSGDVGARSRGGDGAKDDGYEFGIHCWVEKRLLELVKRSFEKRIEDSESNLTAVSVGGSE